MNIFISWSGERSKAVAVIIKSYLPRIIQALKPWMSSEDISAGQRWSVEIGDRLESCDIGICVVTSENVGHSWLNFEAGAISKSIKKSKLVPLLFDVRPSDLSGPLAQFQAKEANERGFFELLKMLNSLMEGNSVDHLEENFNLRWKQIDLELEKVRQRPIDQENVAPQRSDREVLDEILETLRGLQSRPGVAEGVEIVGESNYLFGAFHPTLHNQSEKDSELVKSRSSKKSKATKNKLKTNR